ncbi:MAG: hypothetical protein Q8K72_16095, partial [Acidimicrobiales bacterium]|nr:hypothetical protein [Acidimicrobiales bacterium]
MKILTTRARALVASLALAGALIPFAPAAHASPPDTADGVEVYERDVFVIVGSTLRNPTADTDPGAPLFTDSGVAMDVTWGVWSAATTASRA